jgi:uncharacterized protein YprB with RNaseH-like and TPR domain
MNQVSSSVLDIETTNLSADYGIVMCAAVLPGGNGSAPTIFRGDAYPGWRRKRSDDSKLLQELVKHLEEFDIWIAHCGARFDIPFLRTRLIRWNLPPLANRKLIDPVLLARNKLRMSYNSLKQIANHLGCNSKTELLGELWLQAALDGSTEAMDAIVQHCVEDVKTLDKVAGYLKVYSTTFNTYGSGY